MLATKPNMIIYPHRYINIMGGAREVFVLQNSVAEYHTTCGLYDPSKGSGSRNLPQQLGEII